MDSLKCGASTRSVLLCGAGFPDHAVPQCAQGVQSIVENLVFLNVIGFNNEQLSHAAEDGLFRFRNSRRHP